MREYLTELKIEDYRVVKNLEVKDLSDINVLTGSSCVGKTTVLDYIYNNYENNIYMSSRPRLIFNGLNTETTKEFFTESKFNILELLQIVNNNISDFKLEPNSFDFYILENGKWLYFKQCGNTIETIIEILIKIANAQNKILLIDDIDFNARLSEDVFKTIFDLCIKYEVQLFITTHSLELIEGMLEYDKTGFMRFITLLNKPNQTFGRVLTGTEVKKSKEDFGLEIR